MASPIKSSLRTILPLVATRLTAVTGVTSNRVLLVSRAGVPKFQGDSDLLVRVGPPSPDPDFSPAAGRSLLGIVRGLQVTPRVRRVVDLSDRDDYALLDEDYGLLSLEESVLDALQTFVPEVEDDWLTVQPLLWTPSQAPVHDEPVSQSWLHSDLMFSLRYLISTTDTGY